LLILYSVVARRISNGEMILSGKPMHRKRNLCQCHVVHHKSYTNIWRLGTTQTSSNKYILIPASFAFTLEVGVTDGFVLLMAVY